jgi:Fibronectin type III domain
VDLNKKIWIVGLTVVLLVAVFGRNPHPKKSPPPTPTPTPIIPTVTLTWDAVNDSTLVGYHLWLGFASGQENKEMDIGNNTTTVVQLTSGTTYFFFVTAYNSIGDSLPSNEVSYTTP